MRQKDAKNTGGNTEKKGEGKVGRFDGRANLAPPWKPGQSGNPNGRPRQVKLISDQMKKLMASQCDLKRPDGKRAFPNMTWAQAWTLTMFRLGMKGNSAAIREVSDRTEGKVALPLTGADGAALFPGNPYDGMTLEEIRAEKARRDALKGK